MATLNAHEVVSRAWRDDGFRDSLPAEVRDALPAAPENCRELSDAELEHAAGGKLADALLTGGLSATIDIDINSNNTTNNYYF